MSLDDVSLPPGRSLDHPAVFARYNRWANARLFDACGALEDAAYMASRPSFFGSIHRTLNHILVADRIWLGRLVGAPPDLALDAELHGDRASLQRAREAFDRELLTHCDGLAEGWREASLIYANSRGESFETPLVQVYWHLFNHQTHHRGQVHGLLSHAGAEPPPLDLIYFLRLAGA